MQAQSEQGPQLERDVELLAQRLVGLEQSVQERLEGIRTDFELSLLQQVTKLMRRCERVEVLLAELVGKEAAAEFLLELAGRV